jgi:hypothetical protein
MNWKQLIKTIIIVGLLGPYVFVFVAMGQSLLEHWEHPDLAGLVTTYATFLAIVGALVGVVIKDIFNSE